MCTKIFKLYCLLIFASISSCYKINLRNYNRNNQVRLLANFAANAYHYYCEHCRATLLIHDKSDSGSNMFLRVISKQQFNMSLVSISFSESTTEETTFQWNLKGIYTGDILEFTIIFLPLRYYKNPINVVDFLDLVEGLPFWSRYSKIIIAATQTIPKDYTKWLEDIFHIFWKRKILRVFICFIVEENMKVFMYNPFSDDWAIDITNSTDEEFNKYLEYELFDLNGYPMKTYLYDVGSYHERVLPGPHNSKNRLTYVGIDGKFLTEVRNILNCSLDIHREETTSYWSKFCHYVEKKYCKERNFINYYDFDIWFTVVIAKVNQGVDYVFLHERDDLCFVVPSGKHVPQYLYIFLIIPTHIWIVSGLFFAIIAGLLHFLKRRAALLETFRIFVSAPVANPAIVFSKYVMPERLVLSSWISFAFVLSAVFQSILMSTLMNRKYYPNLETMQDLVDNDVTIYTSILDFAYFNKTQANKELMGKMVRSYEWTIEGMYNHQDGVNAYMVRTEVARGFIRLLKRKSFGKRLNYHVMKEHPMPSAQAYIMPRGHPYYEEMIWMINKVHESGLYYKWRKNDFGYRERLSNDSDTSTTTTSNPQSDTKFVSLKFYHLQSVFYILIIGQFISLTVFLGELLCYKYNKK